MIDLSKKNIVRIANETFFIKDNVEKVMRLIDILETLFSSEWKDKLALKGGTAINLFYRNLPRLSVDIDLDYLGQTKEEAVADKESIRTYLKSALFQKGYALSDASKYHYALDSYVFQYQNNGGNRDNIKVEINFLDRAHILPLSKTKIAAFGYNGEAEIAVLNLYELYGSKFAALIGRSKPRDVYDVYGAIERDLFSDKDLLKKCFVFYNCIGGEADILENDLSIIDGVKNKDYTRMLNPVLSKAERFDPVSAVKRIKEYLIGLLVFTDEERLFVERFKQKTYAPALLFPDKEIIDRISRHPMAEWKCGSGDN